MNHYTTLGVMKDATPEDIKKAYRKLVMEHHPDKGGDITKFQELTNAYETLSDSNKRAAYDNPAAQNSFGQHPGGFNFNVNGFDLDGLFGQMFGRNGNPFQQQPTYKTRVTVSLVDAYNGKEHLIQLSTPDGVKAVNIKIPVGVNSGDQVRYDNIIPNAIFIVEFVVLPDVRFERHGNDLCTSFPISVLDLIIGTKITVNTIAEKKIEVDIKPRTQPTQHIRLAGQGMPVGNGKFGDQILLLRGTIPDTIHNDVIESITRNHNSKGN